MKPVNNIDVMIESCITAASGDCMALAAEHLQRLAIYWAKAGMNLQSFIDIKSYIVASAKKKSNNDNLEKDLKTAETALTKKRKQEWQTKNPRKKPN